MSPRELADAAIRTLLSELIPDLAVLDDLAARVVAASVDEQDERRRAQASAYLALELHRYYTVVEAILERVARQLDGRAPSGGDWHKALLAQASIAIEDLRPPVLSATSARELGALLSFRHFLRHAYAVELDPARLEAHRLRVERVHPALRSELLTLKGHLAAMLRFSDG